MSSSQQPADDDHGFVIGSIDLCQTCDNYLDKYHRDKKNIRLFRDDFALPVVRLAHDVFGARWGAEEDEIAGVRRSLIVLTLRLRRRNYLWRIPLGYEALFQPLPTFPLTTYSPEAKLLVDSLILTVTKYRDELREHHTNLGPQVFMLILWGFQLACGWTERHIPLDPADNDLISLIDVPEIAQSVAAKSYR